MEMRSRLDSLSPELAEMWRAGSRDRRGRTVLLACSRAILDSGLRGADIDAAMDGLRSGPVDDGLADRLNAFSNAYDEKYFQLCDVDSSGPDDALRLFRKARAAAALARAVSADRTDLCEALYEAISASDDEAEAIRAAKTELTAG